MQAFPSEVDRMNAREKVRELVANFQFCQPRLKEIGALLPESDEELHKWLEQTIAKHEENDFCFIIFAAAMMGRRLQASLLPRGTMLMSDDWRFAWIAWRMEGDVTAALLKVVDAGGIPLSRIAMALFIAAAWWKEHWPNEAAPAKITSEATDLPKAFPGKLNSETVLHLSATHFVMSDGLDIGIAEGRKVAAVQRMGRLENDRIFRVLRAPFEELIPEKDARVFRGRTQLRAVEKIGRNKACPCESGKKYKHCCYEKDRERLRHSSDVAGKTYEEVQRDLNADLNRQRLTKLTPAQLLKLDAKKVAPELQEEYLLRLGVFGRLEEVVEAFEKLGVPEHLEKVWAHSFEFITGAWRRDLVVRMQKVWPAAEERWGKPSPAVNLMLASDDPAKFLQALEAEALAALQSGKPKDLEMIAGGIMVSPYSALAILITRGTLPLLDLKTATIAFNDILALRGNLNLSSDDEFSDLMEERAARERKSDETKALADARKKLEAKAAEVRQAREQLTTLQREITLREKRERRDAALQSSAPEPGELRDLRDKVKALKSLITEHAEERVTLRRDLENLHEDLEVLKSASAANADHESHADDEETGEPMEISGNQPVRLIEFPKKFSETLAGFPQHVGRAALNHIGRIASGDASAFMGLVKIYECEDVVRARVAGDYRLLLQLSHACVRVIDLVNRRDLQRRLKVLRMNATT